MTDKDINKDHMALLVLIVIVTVLIDAEKKRKSTYLRYACIFQNIKHM